MRFTAGRFVKGHVYRPHYDRSRVILAFDYIPKGKRKPVYSGPIDVTCVLNLIQCLMQAGALCKAFCQGVSFAYELTDWSPNAVGKAYEP